MAESSKSVGYDRSQLWRVADWIFGDPGAGVRKPVAAELARLIDSAVAGVLAWLLPWFGLHQPWELSASQWTPAISL